MISDYPGGARLARYRERVNGDAELEVIGDWFTTTFGLTFGDTRYAVKVENGSIVDIVTPKLDTRTLLSSLVACSAYHQLPGTAWISGKNMSCQAFGRFLIEPTSPMKPA